MKIAIRLKNPPIPPSKGGVGGVFSENGNFYAIKGFFDDSLGLPLEVSFAHPMTTAVVLVFGFVYFGMLFGRMPRLQLDRTGVALLGAITLLATGAVSFQEVGLAIDAPTLALL